MEDFSSPDPCTSHQCLSKVLGLVHASMLGRQRAHFENLNFHERAHVKHHMSCVFPCLAKVSCEECFIFVGETVTYQPLLSENNKFWAQVEPVSRQDLKKDRKSVHYGPSLRSEHSRRMLLERQRILGPSRHSKQ